MKPCNPDVDTLLRRVRTIKSLVHALEDELVECSNVSSPKPKEEKKTHPEVCGAGGPDELCDDGFCSICVWKGIG